MTQPAVSFQVTQLEEALNVRLFERLHNQIRLTAIGEQVYRTAEAILGLYDDMEQTVRALWRRTAPGTCCWAPVPASRTARTTPG